MFERIKRQVPLLGYVETEVKLKRQGRGAYVGLCPFHSEDTPSFFVYTNEERFRCFGCGAHGDLFDYIALRDNLTPAGALEKAAQDAGIEIERSEEWQARAKVYRSFDRATQHYRAALAKQPDLFDYLRGRGLTDETIATFELGADAEKRAIVIPICDAYGNKIAAARRMLEGKPKYKNSAESDLYIKGQVLYNLHRARRESDGVLIVVEGYMDTWAAHQNGYPFTVAKCGSRLTPDQVEALKGIRNLRKVVLVPDGDETGQNACEADARLINGALPGVSVVVASTPGKDLGDLIHDRDGTRAVIEQAIPWERWVARRILATLDRGQQEAAVEELLRATVSPITRDDIAHDLADAWGKPLEVVREFCRSQQAGESFDPSIFRTIQDGLTGLQTRTEGMPIGFPRIDKRTDGIGVGEIMGILARSQVGKTAFMLNVVNNLASYGPGIVFSFEQSIEPVTARLIQIHYGETRDAAKDRWVFGDPCEALTKHLAHVPIIEQAMTISEMDRAIAYANTHLLPRPAEWIAIDYLQYIRPDRSGNEQEEAARIAKDLKQLAKKHRTRGIVLIQTDREGGDGSTPVTFTMARGSGVIEESCDFLIGLWRPSLADPRGLEEKLKMGIEWDELMAGILKNRNGGQGIVPLEMRPPTLQIRESTAVYVKGAA